MKTSPVALARIGLAFLSTLAMAPAMAESLRCNGHIAAEGDSRLAVMAVCGPPVLKDSFCAPVYTLGSAQPVPEPFASALLPCRLTEDWLYDRGPGNLFAVVRFQSGVVQSIRYGQAPHAP
ncbi:MAG TPA: DUF2845 domain-containing protein [Ideonella sp.]|jgi:hypothetical protein|nr:DUF2845 domain-containing protein [Ideonella sp.]